MKIVLARHVLSLLISQLNFVKGTIGFLVIMAGLLIKTIVVQWSATHVTFVVSARGM